MSRHIQCDVAVVGSGPAGLSAAIALRKAGISHVVVLEREQQPGGAVRHCGSSPFGMRDFHRVDFGPAFARRIAAMAGEAGVDILLGHTVTRLSPGGEMDLATPGGPAVLQAKRVILATGTRETPRSARMLSGLRPIGVMNTGALQAMIYLKGLFPFRRPLIVGTELVSFSALSTCLRHGIRPTAMVESASRCTAPEICAILPKLFGVPLLRNTVLEEILGLDKVEGARLRSGESMSEIACDGILLTGQFQPDAALLRGSCVPLDGLSGGPQIDQLGRCRDPAYFAAGNLLRPVETGGWAWREGRTVGRLVAKDLQKGLPAGRAVDVTCGANLKYVTPQRLSLPLADGFQYLQLRVERPQQGELIVEADGRRIWSRKVSLLPERRCLIPLSALRIPASAGSLAVHLLSGE